MPDGKGLDSYLKRISEFYDDSTAESYPCRAISLCDPADISICTTCICKGAHSSANKGTRAVYLRGIFDRLPRLWRKVVGRICSSQV